MTHLLAYLNSAIMALLGILHLYWAAGGQWGMEPSVPTDDAGNRVLRTGVVTCIVVGLGLLGFAGIYYSTGTNTGAILPFALGNWGIWVLAFIFLARAIGDFRYVGFFKTKRHTAFGKMDTRWYSPLCLYLAISSMYIGLNT